MPSAAGRRTRWPRRPQRALRSASPERLRRRDFRSSQREPALDHGTAGERQHDVDGRRHCGFAQRRPAIAPAAAGIEIGDLQPVDAAGERVGFAALRWPADRGAASTAPPRRRCAIDSRFADPRCRPRAQTPARHARTDNSALRSGSTRPIHAGSNPSPVRVSRGSDCAQVGLEPREQAVEIAPVPGFGRRAAPRSRRATTARGSRARRRARGSRARSAARSA